MFKKFSKSKKRRGAVTVEFAISASLLFAIIFASIEFTRAGMLKDAANFASYLGARDGMIYGASADDAKNAALTHLDRYGIKDATVTVTPATIVDSTEEIVVEVTVPLSKNLWFMGSMFNSDINGATEMITERPPGQMKRGSNKVTKRIKDRMKNPNNGNQKS